MKAALDGVTAELAFWRPAPERHSIAEVALHHAWCVRAVSSKFSGPPLEPFVMQGEDWFALSDLSVLTWSEILKVLDTEQQAARNHPAAGIA